MTRMEQDNSRERERKDSIMTPSRIDESVNTNEGESWHCPDCQSWGPFTVTMLTRVRLSEDETPFLDDEETRTTTQPLPCAKSVSDRPPWPLFAVNQ